MSQSHQHGHHGDQHDHSTQHAQQSSQPATRTPQITMYSTHTCGFCKMEKAWLTEKGVAFTDVDVSSDRTKQDEMVTKSGQMGVPVSIVTDEQGKEDVIVGFNHAKLADILGLAE